MFSLRIVTVESYQSVPIKGYDCFYSEFRSCETYKVPVIRIFGVTPAGQKACLHVHGVFPYLLLRWKDVFPGIDIKDSHRYLQELALEIDKSLHVAARSSNSSRHHVFKISETKGFCFYGYHEDEEDFLRVYFYNPYDINRTTELLANGGILNKVIQPHQAHFPYILQFLTDFNLSGMNTVNVSQFKFRASNGTKTSEPSPLSSLLDSSHSGDRLWNIGELCSSQISTIPRQTHCELELDCCGSDIMNKIDGTVCVGENPGIAAIWAEERLRRKVENDTSPLTPIPSQDRVNAFETPSEIHFKGVIRKMLESQEINCLSSEEVDVDEPMDSQFSLFQSPYESLSLSNTQDKDLLGDLLSMANDNNPENDSILGYVVESDSEETILMSQKFVVESWTSPSPGMNVTSSSSVFEQRTEICSTSTSMNVIPQLDGANDDEDYEQYGPMLFKEEKVSSDTNLTNGTTEFDEEPPVLQPEQPLTSGENSCSPLQSKQLLELEKNCIKQCSVKMEKHPILNNIDPTKPVLLTSLGKSVNKSFFTSGRSSKGVSKCMGNKKSQESQATNAIQSTLHTQNGKKSKKVQHSVTKCVASIVSRVEIMVDGSGISRTLKTLNTELKISKTCVNKVIASSSKCLDSDLQRAAVSRFENNSNGRTKVEKSTDSESLKRSSLKSKASHSYIPHTLRKDKFELSCDKVELNTKDLKVSPIKTSKIKQDFLALPHSDKGSVTNSKSKFPTAKVSVKPNFERRGEDNLALNTKLNLISTGLRDISKPFKNKGPPPDVLKSKPFKKDESSSKRKHKDFYSVATLNDYSSKVNSKPKNMKVDDSENKRNILSNDTRYLMPNNYPDNSLRSYSDAARKAETLNFSKFGNEIVRVVKMTEQEIAVYLKQPSSANTIEQSPKASSSVKGKYTSKNAMCETYSKNISKPQYSQKSNILPQRTKQMCEASPGTKYLIEKLSTEEKTSVVSKSMTSKSSTTQRYTFAKTCFESKSTTTKQNVTRTVFPLFNNDDSDFKSSFNNHSSSPILSHPKSLKLSTPGGKNSRCNHSQLHIEKCSSTYQKSNSSKTVGTVSVKSFGHLEVSNKASTSGVKNVIEEQVKNSLGESAFDEIEEITVISEKSVCASTSKVIRVIDVSSSEGGNSSLEPETSMVQSNVPGNADEHELALKKLSVRIVACAKLIKMYYPDDQILAIGTHHSASFQNSISLSIGPRRSSTPGSGPLILESGPSITEPVLSITDSGPSITGSGPSTTESAPSSTDSCPSIPESSPSIPESSPSIPESSPSIPESSPSIPESSPSIPESSPSIPESSPSIPESAPSIPHSNPSIPESVNHNSLTHEIGCEKKRIKRFSEKSKPMEIANSNLLCAVKTDGLKHDEPSKEKNNFNSTIDRSLISKPILPFAVKSKPIDKTSLNFNGASKAMCSLDNSIDKNKAEIYAVKSLPPIKASSCTQTNINNNVTLNKSAGANALPTPNSCTKSKFVTKNKSSFGTTQSNTKTLDNVTDVTVVNDTMPKADITNKTALPSPVKTAKIEESQPKSSFVSSETILCNNKTEKKNSATRELGLTEEKNVSPKSSTLLSSEAEKGNGTYKGSRKGRKKKGRKSRVKKNLKTLSKNKDISVQKNTATKSFSECDVVNSFASDDEFSKNSTLILSNTVTRSTAKFINCDFKSEDMLSSVLVSHDYMHKIEKCDLKLPSKTTSTTIKEKSTNIFDKKSKSLELPTSSNIPPNDNNVTHREPISEKGLLCLQKNCFKNSAIHSLSNTAVTIQNNLAPKDIGVTKTIGHVELNDLKLTVNDTPENVPIVENDLYDIVKRRNSNKNNSKVNTLVSADKILNSAGKILPNPKSSKCAKKCITKSEMLSFPSKKNNNSSTNSDLVATKEAIVKPKCNAVTEPELPPIDKSFVGPKDEALLNPGEKTISNRTRNKSACKDSVPISNTNVESVVATVPLSTIESQTAKNESPKNPISLVARGGKRGTEDFLFFHSTNPKRRRNSPETAVIPKPLSKKLSLTLNKNKQNNTAKVKNISPLQPVTRGQWKIDKDLLKNALQEAAAMNSSEPLPEVVTIKQEPVDEDDVPAQSSDMKDALSRFDFDESASIEPTSCKSYSSRRSRRNSQNKNDSKASAEKLISQEKKNSKSKCRKGTRKSDRLDVSKVEKIVSDLNNTDNPNFKVMQPGPTIKLKRDRSGQISVVPPNASTSQLKCSASNSEIENSDFQSPSKLHNSKYGTEDEPSFKIKIFKESSADNADPELQCIITLDNSDSDNENAGKTPSKAGKTPSVAGKAVKTTRGRLNRRKSEPYTNPCEPLVPPILIKNIKKEKLDDYDQQPYVVPLKINLNKQRFTECDKNQISEPKCEPLKLSRNAGQFYVNSAVSDLKDETKVKRSRGRPRKVSKDLPPVETEASFSNEKIPVLRIPKTSAVECLEVEESTSFKPLGRKTRSNSARASTSSHWSEVKIKQELISDEEYDVPPNAIPELPTTSSIKSRRRSSLKYENLKHCFPSDSEGSDDSEPKRIKGRSSRKRKASERTKSSSNTNSSQKLPKLTGHRASATTSFTQYFDTKTEDSDECEVLYSTYDKKAETSDIQNIKSSSENSVAISDSTKSNPFMCTVNVQRLLPSEIKKHSLEPPVSMIEKDSQSVHLASDSTGVLKPYLEKSKMPSLETETHSNEAINKKSIEGKHKHDSLSQRRTRSRETKSTSIVTPPDYSLVKRILDSPIGNLKKLASASMENSAETLHENVMKENNYYSATAPPTNIYSINQPEYLPSSEMVGWANVSTPEMVMKENLIEREQCSVLSPGVGRRKDLSPDSQMFAQGSGNFPHGWDSDSPTAIRNDKDVINGSLASSSPYKADNANNSNGSPETYDINCIDVEASKQDNNIDITCISSTDASETKASVVESAIPRRKRNMDGNLFDKVSEEMVKHVKVQKGIFNNAPQNESFSGDNLISLETQTSLPFNASQEMNKRNVPFNKTTKDIQEPFKSLRGGFERRQDNQTVSCFKGYDLLSETGIMPLPCPQKRSRNIFEIQTQEIKASNNLCSPSVSKKSQLSCIHPNGNKHNSVDPNKAANVHNINYPDMQMDNNLHCFSKSNNSYCETNRPQSKLSMQQNKYSNSFCNVKSNLHENENTSSAFNEIGWPNTNTSFCSNGRFTHGQSSNIPLQLQKSVDPFNNNTHQISNSDYFHKQQFGNTDISHLPNYFSPEETRKLWSPIEQSDGSFGKSTEIFLNEHASSSDHYSTGIPSPVPSLPHLSFQRLPTSNDSSQNNHLPGHLSAFHASKEKNNSVESFDTNSLSPMSSSPRVMTVVNETDDIMSPYNIGQSPSDLSKDDDTEEAMKSLSDVLAGSPLDVENDSLSINCDAFSASLEETATGNMHVSQIAEAQIFCKSDTLTSTAATNNKNTPMNKYEDSDLSQLNLDNSFPTLDFTCLTENDVDHNLLDFEEIACNNNTVQTDMAAVSTATVNISKSTYDGVLETKPKNNAATDIKEKNSPLTETLPNTSTNNSTASAIDSSAPYEVPFQNNIIPLVNLNNQPNEECFPQLSIPTFSPVNQTFLPTLMVGESVMVPQPNFFLNDASIIINRDSASQDFVDILPNSAPVVDNSISAIPGSETSSSQEVNNFKQSFNEGEDILSMIVKSCDIGEEFDENLGSPVEDMNESLPSDVNGSVVLDSMIHSFYGDDTLYGLNQTNAETFCSDLQNASIACEATPSISELKGGLKEPHIDNAISSSHLSVLPPSKKSTPELKLVKQTNIEGSSCGLTVNEAKRTVVPFPKMQSISLFSHKTDTSNKTLVLYQKPKKRKNVQEVSSNSYKISSEDSQDSNAVKACDNQKTSHRRSSNLNINSQQHQGKVQLLCKANPTHSNFVSGDNLESTPSANRQENRNFLSEELGVSPINKNNLLTSDTKKKRRLSFGRKTVPYDKNFKKSDKDISAGVYKRFWETSMLTDQGLESGQSLSKSDIDGPTLENSRGFKVNVDDLGDARVKHEVQHLTIMSLEVHVNTRNDLRPDPRFDSVAAIFYSIYNDVGFLQQDIVGMIVVDNSSLKANSFRGTRASLKNFLSLVPCVKKNDVFCAKDENELFQLLISIVREWDPDILVGYEIQMASWGYLIERAGILNLNLSSKLSRLLYTHESKLQQVDQDPTVTDQTADLDKLNIPGRIVLNIWRLLRKEVNLNVYTFENVYFHLLHKRTPLYPFNDLTSWFTSGKGRDAVVRYYATRVVGCVQFLEKFDLIRRTSEMARLFGIQFYEVLSRGTQFRVESMMLRTASPMRYIPVTPSVQQRSKMRAPECVPLILEPQSKYYTNPVLVLDFQSLYPSMIIAYNYCFSTCLGRIDNFSKDGAFDFGCTSLSVPSDVLRRLAREDNIHYSPVGAAFVRSSVRRGILPTMLEEILGTRVLVKSAMKKIRDNPASKKLLDARQMALKLIANVTYGYTAANFSGRMPCVEVADSIVAKGRETLERAIQLVEGSSRWKANVVYGDTDSFFVELPGRTKEEAFKIGQEIVDAVTATNPKPVKLKLEKVYSRCVLEAKKRYVGFMYETVDQVNPVFDAKGIETVRRDSCSATAKILEKSLKILFRSDAIDLVQKYVQKQFRKLLAGRVNMTDLIFAKEYRGKAGYRPTACVPALEIAKKRLAKDPRSEPRAGERVPYVVVYGFPGTPIIKLVHEPADLLKDMNLRINTTYYITRVISPPLDRVFSLMNYDVKTWYNNIEHTVKLNLPMLFEPSHHRETITQYFASRNCASCEETTPTPVCETCRKDPQGTVITLQEQIRKWERTESDFKKICTSCSKSSSSVDQCASVDCPILFKLNLAKRDTSQIPYLKRVLAQELF